MRLLAAIAVLAVVGTATLALGAHTPRSGGEAGTRVPVLAELFTSEGCSSCPPADDLLRRLIDEQPVDGVEVVALSEHVDYWNRLGWSDPFSSPANSARQQRYQRALRTDQIYTPQLVVNGQREAIGNDWPAVRKALADAASGPHALVRVRPETSGDVVRVDVSVDEVPDAASGTLRVMVALAENGLEVDVTRGENARRRLRHAAVMRRLVSAGALDKGLRSGHVTAELPIDPGWRRRELRVLAFVQDEAAARVWGVSSPAPLQ